MYRALDAVLCRAASLPVNFDFPAWPPVNDNTFTAEQATRWLAEVCCNKKLVAAISAASPILVDRARRASTGQCRDKRQLHRIVASVARYMLRMTSRATPFGLFAGVTAVQIASHAEIRWGDNHRPILRAHAGWLDAAVTSLERCPALVWRLPVRVNGLVTTRDDRLVLPYQRPSSTPSTPDATPMVTEVSLRRTPLLSAILTHTRTLITAGDLHAKLTAEFPDRSPEQIGQVIRRLAQLRVLVTALRPPLTVPDGLGYVCAQLTAVEAHTIPEIASVVEAITDLHAYLRAGAPTTIPIGLPPRLAEQLAAPTPGVDPQPLWVDLKLDADITLPHTVVQRACEAARVLTRLTPYPQGLPEWRA